MRNLNELNEYRLDATIQFGWSGDGTCGAFVLETPTATLRVIASTEDDWDHVSVSCEDRIPSWTDMEYIKRRFFKDDETAMQLHVPPQDHINCHPNCLHLWRPQKESIPRPPKWMIAP